MMKSVIFTLILLIFTQRISFSAIIDIDDSFIHTKHFQSWENLKYEQVVRQSEDHSCGAASLATILQMQQHLVSEKTILNLIKEEGTTSFLDLSYVANTYNFFATGVNVSFKQLRSLKVPVIAHLKTKYTDHFTVIRGINNYFIELADPSWGNILISHSKFKKLFSGKILIINSKKINKEFKIRTEPHNINFSLN